MNKKKKHQNTHKWMKKKNMNNLLADKYLIYGKYNCVSRDHKIECVYVNTSTFVERLMLLAVRNRLVCALFFFILCFAPSIRLYTTATVPATSNTHQQSASQPAVRSSEIS